jgi:hypothetical protein
LAQGVARRLVSPCWPKDILWLAARFFRVESGPPPSPLTFIAASGARSDALSQKTEWYSLLTEGAKKASLIDREGGGRPMQICPSDPAVPTTY